MGLLWQGTLDLPTHIGRASNGTIFISFIYPLALFWCCCKALLLIEKTCNMAGWAPVKDLESTRSPSASHYNLYLDHQAVTSMYMLSLPHIQGSLWPPPVTHSWGWHCLCPLGSWEETANEPWTWHPLHPATVILCQSSTGMLACGSLRTCACSTEKKRSWYTLHNSPSWITCEKDTEVNCLRRRSNSVEKLVSAQTTWPHSLSDLLKNVSHYWIHQQEEH